MNSDYDLTAKQIAGNFATYLPALSSFFSKQLGKSTNDSAFIPAHRIPKKFEHGVDGLNFLKTQGNYYNYNFGLYSAGHADRNLATCDRKEPMVHARDRQHNIIIGDSGGFQVATGVIKIDWDTFASTAGDSFRNEILKYLEHTSDWSMTLDIPAFAAELPLSKKTGLTKFSDTLDLSIINLHYFARHRTPGATKFLNVLSGSTPENARLWFDAVKPFSDAHSMAAMGYEPNRVMEGYAFAGINMKNMSCVLERLIDLRDQGLLINKDWIHFLGIGRLDWACYLTSIRRQIQKHINPAVNISFDAASPFVSVAYGLAYNYNYFTPKKLSYSMDRAIDNKAFKDTEFAMPWQSPIMNRLTTGDVCVLGPTDANKNGKLGRTSWDTFSYLLYMSHNLYNHITAVQEINRLADIEYIRYPGVRYQDWSKQKRSSSILDISIFVPSNILFFNDFVKQLFDESDHDAAMAMIVKNRSFLDSISFGGTNNNTFHSMFEVEHVIPTEDAIADSNDARLVELENEV